MSSDSGSGRQKPRRKATRARGTRPATPEPAPAPPEPPRYAPRDGESPFWANAQPRTDSQAWADTQAHLEARNRTDSTPQYAPRPAAGSTPLSTNSSDTASSRGWVTQPAAPTPAPTPAPRRTRQSTPAEDLAGLGAWATPAPERPATPPEPTPAARYDATPTRYDATSASRYDAAPSSPYESTSAAPTSATSSESTRVAGAFTADLSSRYGSAAGSVEATPSASSEFESTRVTPDPTYTQPPVTAVADSRTARGSTELSGPRTAAVRETAERARASRAPRQAADSTAVDADGRPVSRVARGEGGRRRPFIAVAAVLLVITPISWILLHQPQTEEADASLPVRDDSYATPTIKPVDSPTTPPKSPLTPPPGTPTATPTGTPTTSTTPTTPPTGAPTTAPTTSASTTPSVPTTDPDPTSPPTGKPTNTPPPPPPPPPKADGDMTGDEIQLFNRIDSARKKKGCAPLEQDAPVTHGARDDAASRSKSGKVNASGPSMSAAGGDNWSSDQAFDEMMTQSKGTILDCSLTTLGVGRKTYKRCPAIDLFGLCTAERITRVSWVADFN